MVSFENFVKSMPPSLSELKVSPSFCFPFKIPDDPTATSIDVTVVALLNDGAKRNRFPYLKIMYTVGSPAGLSRPRESHEGPGTGQDLETLKVVWVITCMRSSFDQSKEILQFVLLKLCL